MPFGPGSYAIGFVAGLLTILSPCVLPLVPLVLASALQAHARGPLVLAAGLALSFAVVGTAIAWMAGHLGIDASVLRTAGAVALVVFGLLLLSSTLQQRFAIATAGLADAGYTLLSRFALDTLRGQFAIGVVLGLVWSPCVGPTLGSAVVMASRGTSLAAIALLMAVFELGAALPLVVLGSISRAALMRARGALATTGRTGKAVLGIGMAVVGVAILAGQDKRVEAWLVDASPAWLTDLTRRF